MTTDVVKATEKMLTPELREIARFIESRIPAGWGFGTMIFTFEGDPNPALLWISNAGRSDMINAMKEFIEKNGGEP